MPTPTPTAINVVKKYSDKIFTPIRPRAERSENLTIQDTIEKKTTGAATILRAFRYIVLIGDSRLIFNKELKEAGAAADRINPTRIATSIAPSV